MITYEYKCSECDNAFERKQRISDDTLTKCEECNSDTLFRVINTAGGFRIKGKGVYKPTSSIE